MNAQQVSMFKMVSLGVVTANKGRDTRIAQCLPIEIASATDGETTYNPQETTFEGFDSAGTKYQVKATSKRDWACDWLPSEDNRATPPDVRRGEIVAIYRNGDSDQYYWRCMGWKNNLRTLESVVWIFGGSPSPGGAGIDFETCYFMQWSPMDGHVTFGTSKANGEPFAYTFQINTAEGFWTIQDDNGTGILLNSPTNQVRSYNADGSYIDMTRKTIELSADESINLKSGGTSIKLDQSTIAQICSGAYTVQSGSTTYKTASFDING